MIDVHSPLSRSNPTFEVLPFAIAPPPPHASIEGCYASERTQMYALSIRPRLQMATDFIELEAKVRVEISHIDQIMI